MTFLFNHEELQKFG